MVSAASLAAFAAVFLWDGGPPGRAADTAAPQGLMSRAGQLPICDGPGRVNCVVDGDTLWLDGEKIRVADINAPEVSSPGCAREAALGAEATQRFAALLNEAPFAVLKPGFGTPDKDRYGRKLRVLVRDGTSLGTALVSEGLAEEWGGARINWC